MTQEEVAGVLLGEKPGVVRVRLLRSAAEGLLSVGDLQESSWAGYQPAVLEIFRRVRVLDPDMLTVAGRCLFYQYSTTDSLPYHGHAITVQVEGEREQLIGVSDYPEPRWMPPGKVSHTITVNFSPHAG